MTPELAGLLGLCLLLLLIFLRMHIGLAMASVGLLGLIYLEGMRKALGILSTTAYNTAAYYPVSVIPLFVFMGTIIAHSGLGDALYESAYKWFGHLKGGLAIATIAACTVFAALCGSSTAETVTIGRIALPEMRKYNYHDAFACGCVACAGSLAILIPPSIGFLIYGILTEQSIGLLFIAGILPGILLSLLFVLVVIITAFLNPNAAPQGSRSSMREKVSSLKVSGPVLALLVLILGGIYFGFFTPTEAGAVGAFGAIVITYVSGYMERKKFLASLLEAGSITAMILLLMIGAFIFMRFVTVSKLAFSIPEFIGRLGLSPYLVLSLIVVFYILFGMFFEIMSGMTLTLPLIYPIIVHLGFDPIWFGVVLVLLMEMGLATPPIGLNVFLLSTVTDVPMKTIFRGVWPFVGAIFVAIVIVVAFPELALFLPAKMLR